MPETAIVVAEEYAYLREHLPGWQFRQQSLIQENGRLYDLLELEDSNGAERQIYFDVTDMLLEQQRRLDEGTGNRAP